MFHLDHDTITVIEIMATYYFGAVAVFAISSWAFVSYDWKRTPKADRGVRKLHQMQCGQDLEHIEIALKQD